MDELTGRWDASMWDEGIPDVLRQKMDNMVSDMEIKYHQLVSEERRHRVSEVMNSTQRSSQMESLFGTVELSDESDSDEEKSGDDSFGNIEMEECKTPISYSRKIPPPTFDCMKSSDVTPVTTEESPEEQKKVYIMGALTRVVDETLPDSVSPKLVTLMNSKLPQTPRSIREPRRVTTPMTTKTDVTPVTPTTVVKKRGPACKTTHKAVVEQKNVQTKKKTKIVEVVDEE